MRCSMKTNNGDSPEMMADSNEQHELDGTVSWAALLTETEGRLDAAGITDNPKVEAKWIIEEVTGAAGADFIAVLDHLATVRGVAKLDALVERRVAGEPIQYVLGHWPFRSIDLMIDKRVLIPRPETEVVAGLALAELDRVAPSDGATVIDLGTGSGAIGLSIAVERPNVRVLLTDSSADALSVARANLAGIGNNARGVEISEGSWFDAVPVTYSGKCHVIVSNPPYVPVGEQLDRSVVDWEPESALRAGDDGLDDLRLLVENAGAWLTENGSLVLEMAPDQTEAIAELGAGCGYVSAIHKDLAGLDRAVVLRRV